jgi:hypothetical protein
LTHKTKPANCILPFPSHQTSIECSRFASAVHFCLCIHISALCSEHVMPSMTHALQCTAHGRVSEASCSEVAQNQDLSGWVHFLPHLNLYFRGADASNIPMQRSVSSLVIGRSKHAHNRLLSARPLVPEAFQNTLRAQVVSTRVLYTTMLAISARLNASSCCYPL